MNLTPEQLRAAGWVEKSPGQWVKDSLAKAQEIWMVRPNFDLGAGGGVESRHATATVGNPVENATPPSGISAPPARTVKRLRQSSKPLLNKLETEFAAVLQQRYGQFGWPVMAQAIRFRLGNGIWYKPDFVVFGDTGMMAFEVKGPHAFRGGFENLKVAASLYSKHAHWRLVWKQDGQWQTQAILA